MKDEQRSNGVNYRTYASGSLWRDAPQCRRALLLKDPMQDPATHYRKTGIATRTREYVLRDLRNRRNEKRCVECLDD